MGYEACSGLLRGYEAIGRGYSRPMRPVRLRNELRL
jgi:hypothetical protein